MSYRQNTEEMGKLNRTTRMWYSFGKSKFWNCLFYSHVCGTVDFSFSFPFRLLEFYSNILATIAELRQYDIKWNRTPIVCIEHNLELTTKLTDLLRISEMIGVYARIMRKLEMLCFIESRLKKIFRCVWPAFTTQQWNAYKLFMSHKAMEE